MLKPRNIWSFLTVTAVACCSIFLYAQQRKEREQLPAPEALMRQSQRYQSQDSLGAWLQCCTDFIKESPEERYNLYAYMDTALWRAPRRNSRECSAYFRYLLAHGYDALKIYGDVPASKNCYETALRLYDTARREVGKDSVYLAAYLLKPLANIYTRLGDYKSALLLNAGSLDVWLRTGDTEEIAAVQGNMALAWRWQDSLQPAWLAAQAGLQYAVKDSRVYAYLQSIAAEISFCRKDFKQARNAAAAALHTYQQLLHQPGQDQEFIAEGLSGVYSTRALLAAAEGQWQQAVADNKEALNYLQHYFPNGHKREQAIVWRQLGDVFYRQQDYGAGIKAYDKSIRQLVAFYPDTALFPARELLFADNTLIDAIAGKSACLLAMNNKAAALQGLMIAAAMEQQLRLHFQSRGAKLDQLAQARRRTEQILELASSLFEQSGEEPYLLLMLQQIERSKAQLLTEQWVRRDPAQDNGRRQLEAGVLYYRQWLVTHDTGTAEYSYYVHQLKEYEYRAALEDVQGYHTISSLVAGQDNAGPQYLLDAIPQDMLALEYFSGQQRIYVLSLVHGHVAGLKIIDSAAYWQHRVLQYMDTWYYNGAEAMQEMPDSFCRHSCQLLHTLMPDIAWRQYRYCLVLPDDYLYRLPFEALQTDTAQQLQDPASWPYLMRQVPVQTDASLQLWRQRQLRQQKSSRRQDPCAVVCGFFVAAPPAPYTPLPEVRKEYEQMGPVFKIRMRDQKATKSALLQALEEHKVVHVSTHGLTDQDPALVMGDSLLYAWELNAHKAVSPLVVLNTCRGADGITEQGEGMVSMARYLTAAGFNGVIAALWNVNDQAGSGLMQSFYRQLVRVHYPDRALQQAKTLWLSDAGIAQMNKVPYYWAGFTYTGITQEIIPEVPLSRRPLLIAGILVLLCTGGYACRRFMLRRTI